MEENKDSLDEKDIQLEVKNEDKKSFIEMTLSKLNLPNYVETFVSQGYRTEEDFLNMTQSTFTNLGVISDHIMQLFKEMRNISRIKAETEYCKNNANDFCNFFVDVLVVGSGSVGKSTLLHRYIKLEALKDAKTTMEEQVIPQKIHKRNMAILFTFHDLPGQKNAWKTVEKIICEGKFLSILGVCSVEDNNSMTELERYFCDINDKINNKLPSRFYVFCNKADMRKKYPQKEKELQRAYGRISLNNGFSLGERIYFVSSLKDDDNVINAVDMILEDSLSYYLKPKIFPIAKQKLDTKLNELIERSQDAGRFVAFWIDDHDCYAKCRLGERDRELKEWRHEIHDGISLYYSTFDGNYFGRSFVKTCNTIWNEKPCNNVEDAVTEMYTKLRSSNWDPLVIGFKANKKFNHKSIHNREWIAPPNNIVVYAFC